MSTEDLHRFLNYQNGRISLDPYRTADAIVTDLADLLLKIRKQSSSTLTATIETEFERAAAEELMELAAKQNGS
jgi:hypothetical protein